jgi:hypothetical protein
MFHPYEIIMKRKLYKTKPKIKIRTGIRKKTEFSVVHLLANRGQAANCHAHRERD